MGRIIAGQILIPGPPGTGGITLATANAAYAAKAATEAAIARVDPGSAGTPGYTAMFANGTPVWGRGRINVESYGKHLSLADADDDWHTAIGNAETAAISAGLPLYFPNGTYGVSASLEPSEGATWLLDDGATLTYQTGSAATFTLMQIVNSDVRIRGGRLLGTFDWGTSRRSDTDGQVANQWLLKVDGSLIGSGETLRDVTVEHMTWERAGRDALRIQTSSNRTVEHIAFRHVDVLDCRQGIALYGGDRSATNGWVQDISFHDLYVNDTWGPVTTPDSSKGGNAFAANTGVIDRLTIDGFRVDQCGRMAMELFATALSSYGITGRDATITNCDLGESLYRTLSFSLDGGVVSHITARDTTSYIEFSGRNVEFTHFRIYGSGILLPDIGASPSQALKDYSCTNNTFAHGVIVNPSTYSLQAFRTGPGNRIEDIDIIVDAAMPAGLTGVSQFISVRDCFDLHVSDIRVRVQHTIWERAFITFTNNAGCSLRRCQMDADSRVTSIATYGGSAAFNPITISDNINCVIEDNALRVVNAMAAGSTVAIFGTGTRASVTRRVFTSATTYTDTACTVQTSLNTPPGSPSAGQVYLVGDSPTGAWASNPVSFATWDGAAWLFQPVLDFYAKASAYWPGSAMPSAPTQATTGDVYGILDRASIGNRFERNHFDPNRKLTTSWGHAIAEGSDGAMVFWRNAWIANGFTPTDRNGARIGLFGDAIVRRHGDVPTYFYPASLPPACAANRGKTRRTIAAAGTADQVAVCTKDAANAYAWRSLI